VPILGSAVLVAAAVPLLLVIAEAGDLANAADALLVQRRLANGG
jgi:hypothetical protein